MIKAIETRYKDYRFRSRVEARWAIFFDTLNVPWEYEKQGFDLGDAGKYLPDFWMPLWEAWFEVKALPLKREEKDWKKVRGLANGDRPVVVASCSVGAERLQLFCHDSCNSGGGESEWTADWSFTRGGLPLLFVDTNPKTVLLNHEWQPIHFTTNTKTYHPQLQEAYRAARSARFEHGERPRK